jgi:hypothetical protein
MRSTCEKNLLGCYPRDWRWCKSGTCRGRSLARKTLPEPGANFPTQLSAAATSMQENSLAKRGNEFIIYRWFSHENLHLLGIFHCTGEYTLSPWSDGKKVGKFQHRPPASGPSGPLAPHIGPPNPCHQSLPYTAPLRNGPKYQKSSWAERKPQEPLVCPHHWSALPRFFCKGSIESFCMSACAFVKRKCNAIQGNAM